MDDFGGKLRQARERRGISLRQIATATKISPAALEALERNDISKLPGGIFSRAFVRSYASEVGLDPDDTVREFLERFNQEPAPTAAAVTADIPEEERQFQERQRRAARLAIAGAAALVMIVVAAAIGYRASRARPAEQAVQQPVAAPGPATEPAPAPEPPPAPAATAGGVPPAPAPNEQLTLDIAPTAECWVSITVDGRKLLARVMPAGEKQSFVITKDATVEIGDAGAFGYSVNGKPGKPLGGSGQIRTLKLTPATAAQYIR